MNHIYDYYSQIKSGQVIVGKYIKQIYEYIIKGLEDRQFFFNAKKAQKAVRFIEEFCHHCEGRDDLLILELWQKALVSIMFGIVDGADIRIFREVFVVVGRKNGKSLLASAIMAYMAYMDDEYGANLYCLAPKLEQAAKVFDAFYQMVQKDEELLARAKKRRSDIRIEGTNTTIKPLAFNAKKSDGFNPHFTVCDEISSWSGDNGLKQYEVMKSALGSRKQPMILSISTAGFINDGIYDELMKRSTAFLNGNSKEQRLLPLLYIIDNVNEWNKKEELRKSNPNMDISVSFESFYREEIAVAENSLSKKSEFLTKYCNIKQSSSVAWLRRENIDAIFGDKYSLEDFRGSYCVGGIDLSQTTDLTSCCVLIQRKDVLYTVCQFFMPANKVLPLQEREGVPYEIYIKQGLITVSGENYVDYNDCFEWFKRMIEVYEIYPLQIGYDRYSAQSHLQDLKNYGFHTDDVYQGENLTPVIREAEGLILDKTLRIGNNNLLKAHFLNVAMKQNAETRKMRPVKIEERTHIDGFVSVLDALTVRQKWWDTYGEQLKNN